MFLINVCMELSSPHLTLTCHSRGLLLSLHLPLHPALLYLVFTFQQMGELPHISSYMAVVPAHCRPLLFWRGH